MMSIGGHVDGNGEVVGRHFEGEKAIRQDICCW